MWQMEKQRVKVTWLWAVMNLLDIDLAREKGWKSNVEEEGEDVSPN